MRTIMVGLACLSRPMPVATVDAAAHVRELDDIALQNG